jgi:chemotaxis protein histidine kinase CheA
LADPNQYLRLRLGETSYLLPSASGFTIEQREHLVINKSPDGNVAAWQSLRSQRLPAYCLDDMLQVARHDDWHRAVFLDATPHAVGLVVDEVQLVPRSETVVSPFTPLGLAPTRRGHLFSGAWVTGNRIVLVFDPKAFVAYLQSLGDA